MELATVFQARGAFLQLLLIYAIICTVPLGLGTYLLIAPRRAGNFLNDAFAIFPHVEPQEHLKKGGTSHVSAPWQLSFQFKARGRESVETSPNQTIN